MTGEESANCAHCGLEVPRVEYRRGAGRQFCCAGCRAVHKILAQHGLSPRYYRLVDRENRQRATVTDRRYREFDSEWFQSRYVRQEGDGYCAVEFFLEAVHCSACVWLVEKLPSLVAGVRSARLDLGRQRAEIKWDRSVVSLGEVARKLDSLGLPAHPYRSADRAEIRRAEDRRLIIRIGVAGACAGNAMLYAAALYAGYFDSMESEYLIFFRWASFLVSLPSFFFCAPFFFRGALASLRARLPHMDLPISIGICAGFFSGALNTIVGSGEIYFDSVTVLIFLLLVGRWLELRHRRKAYDTVEALLSLAPTSVTIISEPEGEGDGEKRRVGIDEVEPGMRAEILAGDTFPIDGVVVQGSSAVDASMLSGESDAKRVDKGDEVTAGTLNLRSPLLVRVTAAGEATRIGKLTRLIQKSAKNRAPVVLLADRITKYFVGTVLALAVLTALYWSQQGFDQAIERAMSLLIVTCPCALGLATPLALAVAMGRAAARGILIKGGDVVERLSCPGQIFFDKTGTLTEGEQTLLSYWGCRASLGLAAALEERSSHPLARALVRDAPRGPLFEVVGVEETLGGGIKGIVGGKEIALGSASFVGAAISRPLDAAASRAIEEALAAARTPVLIAVEGQVVGVAAFGDPLRANAGALLGELRDKGWFPRILSGDHPRVVAAAGRELGFSEEHLEGGATPERKLQRIEAELLNGPVVMVGDGVNDAAAMAAATASIAVHGGAEASLNAADVFLSRPGLEGVIGIFRGARGAMRVIRENILFSLLFNIFAAGLAMSGAITPLVSAVLMPLSSLTVISSSLRRGTFPET